MPASGQKGGYHLVHLFAGYLHLLPADIALKVSAACRSACRHLACTCLRKISLFRCELGCCSSAAACVAEKVSACSHRYTPHWVYPLATCLQDSGWVLVHVTVPFCLQCLPACHCLGDYLRVYTTACHLGKGAYKSRDTGAGVRPTVGYDAIYRACDTCLPATALPSARYHFSLFRFDWGIYDFYYTVFVPFYHYRACTWHSYLMRLDGIYCLHTTCGHYLRAISVLPIHHYHSAILFLQWSLYHRGAW